MRSARLRRGSGVSRTWFISTRHSFRSKKVLGPHILHDTDRLLRLPDKLILSLFNLRPRLLGQILFPAILAPRLARQIEDGPLRARLGRIETQSRVLDGLARARRKLDIRVQRRAPARQEAALNLRVLSEPRLAHLLARDGVLLERGGERVFAGRRLLLGEQVRGVESGAGDGVGEGLGLGLCRGRGGQGGLRFGGGRGVGEEVDFLRDGAAEVGDGLADVGGVVVGLVGVL
jgi:hypothetical protein